MEKQCPDCHKKLKGKSYNNHINYYCKYIKNENIKCEYCNKTLKNKHIYTRHKNLYHNGTVTCLKCNKILKNKNVYSTHKLYCNTKRKRKRNKVKCSRCKKKFANILAHSKICGKINCRFCKRRFIDIHNHYKDVHPTFPKCNLCDKYFISKINLYFHNRNIHNQGYNKCNICNKIFNTKSMLDNHRTSHRFKIKCLKCNKMINNRYYKRHLRICNIKFINCNLCHLKFKNKETFEKHKLKHLNSNLLSIKNNHDLLKEKLLEYKNIFNEIIN